MPDHAQDILLFTYGTLQVSAVMRKITGRCFPAQPALLKDFVRFRVKNAIYPAIKEQTGAQVWGVLYSGVDAFALDALDAFEGEFYLRQMHPVEVGGQIVQAHIYVMNPLHAEIESEQNWNLREFLSNPESRYYF